MLDQIPGSLPNIDQIYKHLRIADTHIHPSFQLSLFQRNLLRQNYVTPRWILSPRSSLPQLRDGNVRLIFSAINPPEREMLEDFPWLRIIVQLVGVMDDFLKPVRWLTGERDSSNTSLYDLFNKPAFDLSLERAGRTHN